jgi:serine/threonine-protein kinase HipA
MADSLNVWMNGILVGNWSYLRSKTSVFQYKPSWMESAASRPLSLSMPMTAGNSEHRGQVVDNYFDNLLPDNEAIRQRIRTRYATRSTEAFELLTAIGRDCVGAVQLLAPSKTPQGWDKVASDAMSEADVARHLRAASSGLLLGQGLDADQDFRISIAGAQEKTALLKYGGSWRMPKGATPTTHILKLPLGIVGNQRADLRDSVENEWLCSKILGALGFQVAATEMESFEGQKTLVVERFDRRWQGIAVGQQNQSGFEPDSDVWIARLPQEDFCQMTGRSPSQKYESHGGPGITQCLGQLAGSQTADADRTQFALTQLAFWLLAATDGHAKNFSVFHLRGGSYRMTPLYDVISVWPYIGAEPHKLLPYQDAKLAMALHSTNTHYRLNEVRVRHWQRLARECGVDGVWEKMLQLVEGIDRALQAVESRLPAEFPQHIWSAIRSGAREHAAQFHRELALLDNEN